MPYLSEAVRAAEEGVPLALIDRAAEEFGMPMGPIELADVVGLDVVMSVGKVFFESAAEVPPVLSSALRAEEIRQEDRRRLLRMAERQAAEAAVPAASAPPDLQDRLILPLVNEAVAVLREHVVDDADLVDAGVIFGAGLCAVPRRSDAVRAHARRRYSHGAAEELQQRMAIVSPPMPAGMLR